MINKLKQAISAELKREFPDYTVYPYNPSQNMKEPCFIIQMLESDQNDLLMYDKEPEVSIINFPFTVTFVAPPRFEQLESVLTLAKDCLKWLFLDDKPVLTLNRVARVTSDTTGVITFNIKRERYSNYVRDPYMEELIEEIKYD